MRDCLSDNMVVEFVEGRIRPQAAASIQAHIRMCESCRALIDDALLGALAETPPGIPAAPPPALPFSPPEVLEEYRLLRPLGQGAMGQVYLGHDTLLDRPVAIKFVAGASQDETARERFLIEARAIARLHHPNVVAIYRVAAWGGRTYLVSEFIPGRGLEKLALPLPWREALRIGIGLARALAAAHRRGVLHRDIKPANVMLTEQGEVKLLDFGLAKVLQAGPADVSGGAPSDLARSVEGGLGLTRQGAIVGTPLYLAPEVWQGELATPASDVYALGVVLYELCTGRTPHRALTLWQLGLIAQTRDAPPLASVVPGIDAGLAAVVDRCLARDAAARFTSGEELCLALEQIVPWTSAPLPSGNPYRGLYSFEAEHRALFFGRGPEIQAVLGLLREEPLVLLTGDSGVGKSSLCRAGVLPAVLEGALGEQRGYALASLVPGREPLFALAAALSPVLGFGEEALAARLREDPAELGRLLRRRGSDAPGVLLFIDQMEELLTQAEPAERDACAEVLRHLALRTPGVRLLMTVRGDFLTRLAALPGAGRALCRVLYILEPLQREALREAVLGPARARGVAYESAEMVQSLVESTVLAPGGLPLLQFALAELWEVRDQARGVIPASALPAIGGVTGALERHADGVLQRLLPEERAAARRLLLHLVTAEGTRARRGDAELLGGSPPEQAALDALVRGRLLVAHQAEGRTEYEVAHEALVQGWGTLRGWLDASVELRALRERLTRAAGEWARLGQSADSLWGERQLREVGGVPMDPAELPAAEAAFLRASRRSARRRRLGWLGAVLSVPLSLGLIYGGLTLRARYQLDRLIEADLGQARAALADGRRRGAEVEALRGQAFAAFEKRQIQDGELAWARSLEVGKARSAAYGQASRALETALLRDSRRGDVRRLFAEVIYEQALAADQEQRIAERDDLLLRLANYDEDGAARRRFFTPARLELRSAPEGAEVVLQRYEEKAGQRRPGPERRLGEAPLVTELPPGSYLLTLRAPGRAAVRYPLLVGRGERVPLHVELPLPAAIPPGFVYVPPGRFLYGSADDEGLRRDLLAQPLHPVTTGAYLISRTEVTFAEWMDFLAALPPAERARRRPFVNNLRGALELKEGAGGRWQLAIKPTAQVYTAAEGEPLRYPERERRAAQDWRRFPVSAVSWEDALAYFAWLGETGKVPGARMCTEHEWERAARGADSRLYAPGDRLEPDDANHDVTYGRKVLAYGPDEVGVHPGSDSPFGVADTIGNVWEWTRSVVAAGEIVYRGGSWYYGALSGRSMNRQMGESTQRDIMVGVRVCATPKIF